MSVTVTQPTIATEALQDEEVSRKDRRLLEGYLHKTSNTLCGIKGYASLIADRGESPDDTGRWARKIIAEIERMEEIFRSVGDLSRHRRTHDLGVDLPMLVSDLAHGFESEHEGIRISIQSVAEAALLLPVSDLALVLEELLSNSLESAASEQESVTVAISHESSADGRVFLILADNGSGMGEELAAQAPDPFVTTRDDHHGVGLTRVDTLMDMYGLAWAVRSMPAAGTVVTLEVAEVL